MPASTPRPLPIERARAKTRDVREDLHVAGGELNLSTTVLERALPDPQKSSDVRRAIEQAGSATEKVEKAREELHEVEDLLAREVAERERLEAELARRERPTGTGGSTRK